MGAKELTSLTQQHALPLPKCTADTSHCQPLHGLLSILEQLCHLLWHLSSAQTHLLWKSLEVGPVRTPPTAGHTGPGQRHFCLAFGQKCSTCGSPAGP